MNASELTDLIKSCEHQIMWREWFMEEFFEDDEPGLESELSEKGYFFKNVEQFGGEGKGDQYWVVFSVTHNDEVSYFKINGWYASYDGVTIDEWDFFEAVKVPVQTHKWVKK
jgi:hypothetical protein